MLGWLSDAASDVAGGAWDAVTEAADVAVDTVGAVASGSAGAVTAVGHAVDSATFGAASGVLDTVDDLVFDPVEQITGGAIALGWENGNLRAGVDLGPVVSARVGVGEDGIHKSAGALNQRVSVGVDQDGLEASGAVGLDVAHLPYAEAAVAVGANDEVLVDLEAKGTILTPYGVLSGSAEVDVVRTADRLGLAVDADGTLRRPDGSVIRAGADVAYAETEDGSVLTVGLEGAYTHPGLGTIGGSVGYQRLDDGETLVEGFQAEVDVDAVGARLDAGVEMTAVTTEHGTLRDWEADADLSGPGLGQLGALAGAAIGEPAIGVVIGDLADDLLTGPTDLAGADESGSTVEPPAPTTAELDPLTGELPAVDPVTGATTAPTAHGSDRATTSDAVVPDVIGTTDETPPEAATAAASPTPPPAPAPVPDTALDTALASADASEASVDELFSDLA